MTENEAADTAFAAAAEGAPAAESGLAEALAQAQASAEENWNKYLRAAAEIDNVRKRAARDLDQARKFAIERFAGELLEVLDTLERALAAGAQASAETLIEGNQATLRLLKAALEKSGVVEVSPDGEAFDPQLHEALSVQPGSATQAPGSVLAVIQKGYQLNGRLLRPARVVVAAEAPAAIAGEPADKDA